jgi:predicted metalloprotease
VRLDDVDGSGFEVEDRRGQRSAGGGMGGLGSILGGAMGGKGGKLGIPALLVIVIGVVVAMAGGGGSGGSGGDLGAILDQLGAPSEQGPSAPTAVDGSKDAPYEFVADVGTLLEDHWRSTFEASGEPFERAGLVVFDAPTDTGGCGVGTPQAGPFYCPPSKRIFIDFGFYQELERQLGFSGDFAMAYVLAHEYGHHIQNLLGIDDQVREAQADASEAEANALLVRLELQADCLAGVWAKSAFDDRRLEDGDFDEAIDAAEAVGDDAILGANANQESFTHGSSAQRKRWFTAGFEAGEASACDTFA